jgi:Zn-dependent protease/CBS domain-containing protein
MSWSFQVARPLGIPIRVHASFLLVLVLGALQWSSHGLEGAAFGALLSLAVFACVALHELGHSVAARAFGLEVRQIVLLPLGGIAELVGRPKRPRDEVIIALAGPFVNVVIASVLFGGFAVAHAAGLGGLELSFREPSLATFLHLVFASNVMLAAFNLLPFFPLDGGRVLRALLASRWGDERATRWASWAGQIGAVGLGIWAVVSGQLLLGFIAALLFTSAGSARVEAQVPALLDQLYVGQVCERGPVLLEPATTTRAAFAATLSSTQSVFPVALGGELLGALTREDIRRAALVSDSVPVTLVMRREMPVVHEHAKASTLLAQLERDPEAIVKVQGAEGLIGFVSLHHLVHHVLPFAEALALYRSDRDDPTRAPARGST